MTISRLLTALAAAGALSLAGAPAGAQPQGGGGQAQQQDLPQLLHLRPDQMAMFHTLQGSSQPSPDELARLRGASPQALAGLPTPQRLDRIGAALGAQQAMFRRSSDATRAFYSQLSPDQQRSFDHLSAPPQGAPRGRPR